MALHKPAARYTGHSEYVHFLLVTGSRAGRDAEVCPAVCNAPYSRDKRI